MDAHLRSNFLPRSLVSFGACGFIILVIPLVYWFELFVVLPTLYEVGSFYHCVHLVVAHFLLFNVTGSYLGLLLIDNSVKRHVASEDVTPGPDWRHCDKCNIKVPPRAWHCDECDACMLKRDHHCLFTGYCIGHHNHRLFITFLFYMLVTCIYATFYNIIFLKRNMDFMKWLLRTIFALPLLVFEKREDQCPVLYLLVVHIVMAGGIFTLMLFVYHSFLLIRGSVGHEKKYNISNYNMGTKQNFINVFGERWYLSLLSPFVSSQLPSNGFNWGDKSNPTKKL